MQKQYHMDNNLPTHVHTKLSRWYIISGSALIITLIACSAVHLITTRRVYTLRHAIQAHVSTFKPTTQNATKNTLHEQIEPYRTAHVHLYELLQTVLNEVSSRIQFTQLLFEPYVAITCRGVSKDTTAITDLLQLLKKLHYATITQLTTEPSAHRAEIPFTLRVAYLKV